MSAQILPFMPRTKPTPRPEASGAALPAVVIFPGVRYERLEAETEAPAALPQRH